MENKGKMSYIGPESLKFGAVWCIIEVIGLPGRFCANFSTSELSEVAEDTPSSAEPNRPVF